MRLNLLMVIGALLTSSFTFASPKHIPDAMQSGRTKYYVNTEGTDCIETRNVATEAKLSVSAEWIRTTKQVCDEVNHKAAKKD